MICASDRIDECLVYDATMTFDAADPISEEDARAPSAQAALLNFFGAFVLDRPDRPQVPTSTMIEVCQRLGIGEHAVRSTLNRMVTHDLLRRERTGRITMYQLTERSIAVLRDGRRRIRHESTDGEVDAPATDTPPAHAEWTLLAFSLPTTAGPKRHVLRTRLQWAGFGPLQNGLWIAPAPADLSGLIDDPEFAGHLHVFDADTHPVTDMRILASDIWDLDTLAQRYRDFIAEWGGVERAVRDGADPLRVQLVSGIEWIDLLRQDPRLPAACLPTDWPAAAAEDVFRRVDKTCTPAAEALVDNLLTSPPPSD